jgi:hypothetical protein
VTAHGVLPAAEQSAAPGRQSAWSAVACRATARGATFPCRLASGTV